MQFVSIGEARHGDQVTDDTGATVFGRVIAHDQNGLRVRLRGERWVFKPKVLTAGADYVPVGNVVRVACGLPQTCFRLRIMRPEGSV
jgi:hypothetical protein